MKKYTLFLLFCTLTLCVNAQRGFEAGGWLGVSNYFGDLNTDFALKDPGYSAGIIGRYNFNERTAFKMG